MKCFIASAFGRDDVDAIYDRCIVPTLRKLAVTPLRVDRVEHNEDIDNKIFDLLDSADFVIADLSYARPSVYYEAGYATGKSIPVIFIARHDHFRARDNDAHGNFRVHFDLQMRNIISWTKPDSTFTNKLRDRIQLVLRRFERANKSDLNLKAERSEFNRQPVYSRLQALHKKSVNLLRSRGFRRYGVYSTPHDGNNPIQVMFLRKTGIIRLQSVGTIATPSASKTLLQNLALYSYNYESGDYPSLLLRETHYAIASLNSVPQSRVIGALPAFHPKNNVTFVKYDETSKKGYKKSIYIHVIDKIKSLSEFENEFRKIIDERAFAKGS